MEFSMPRQNVLALAVVTLLIVVGLLVYDRERHQETIGEKVGSSIDRAVGHMDNAVDGRH
jgi:hypothetical protein